MSLIQRLTDLITAIKTETKALRTMISGTSDGNVTGLQTTATNLVSAINEVRAAGVGVSQQDVDAAVAALRAELLGGAGPTIDTLQEIADLLATNTSTDAALAAVVANKANASEVFTKAEIGDVTTDLAALWAAA